VRNAFKPLQEIIVYIQVILPKVLQDAWQTIFGNLHSFPSN